MPATAKQLAEKPGIPGRRVALDEQHNSGFTRGTTSAWWADHGCDTHRGTTESHVSAGASRYPGCYVVFANCMIYIFEATGKPGHEWRSGLRVVHFYASFVCRCRRSRNRTVLTILVAAKNQRWTTQVVRIRARQRGCFTVLRPRDNCRANRCALRHATSAGRVTDTPM
jgi:hypothetical protein